MTRIRIMALVAAFVIGPGSAPAGDLAAEVRTVFATKCTACHGADLAKPKGRFGYVLDLVRVAGDPEKIIRGAPEESELWELVRRGEMPPEDSPTGPLTADQKETVRAWIAAGAPAPASENAATVSPSDSTASGTPGLTRTLRQLGRLHVLLVHFPIALLIAAAAGEVWSIIRGRRTPAPAVHFCVVLGAAG
ncbi:MAG TPA: c-type cytochrome domain-containing protein, partial [Gemmataceae bacterium]|nr:c-type cytochrome domain-containing protein [Gemmataceae bacterium]